MRKGVKLQNIQNNYTNTKGGYIYNFYWDFNL